MIPISKPLYRLLRKPFSVHPFNGEGSFRYGGRWSRPGTRIAYTAEHLSLAMVEYLAHLDRDRPPTDLVLARADVPVSISRLQLNAQDLPVNWRSYPPPEALQAIGDQFARALQACILIVPSALAVTDNNWLLNPTHPDFHRITFHPAQPFNYDPRLLKTP